MSMAKLIVTGVVFALNAASYSEWDLPPGWLGPVVFVLGVLMEWVIAMTVTDVLEGVWQNRQLRTRKPRKIP